MHFSIRYLVYPVRTECSFEFSPVFPVCINPENTYTLEILPFSGLRLYGLRNKENRPTAEDLSFFKTRHVLTIKDDRLTMPVSFPQEDCYLLRLYVNDQEAQKLEVYALNEDLFSTTPYKGDNHMHTYYSDGKESPVYLAATLSRMGYDYCAITDHHKYEPSIEAKAYFEKANADFLVVPGEEIHSPDNIVHIISFGAEKSVNAWLRECPDEYREKTALEMEKIPEPLVDADKYCIAASQVVFEKIREAGGVSILCHPYWILPHGFNQSQDITDYLFDHRRFDALELIAGGAFEDGTQMQVSYYHDRETMPILGSSDTHNVTDARLSPGNYTIMFASALTTEALKEAVLSGRTVAGNKNKLYGDYRLMKYAYFLLRNYYPAHDAARNSLGAKMQRFASCADANNAALAAPIAEIRPSEMFEPLRWKNA